VTTDPGYKLTYVFVAAWRVPVPTTIAPTTMAPTTSQLPTTTAPLITTAAPTTTANIPTTTQGRQDSSLRTGIYVW